MNLLPKTHEEFSRKDYWNKFFKKRGTAFEWYGEYLQLCSHLHKYIKQKDHILITGCGNSSLSSDLYDVGYQNITNIDISEVVIKQMQTKNAARTDMKFLYMDVTKMSFENDTFNVVLDKGTLDALMPDESDETLAKINEYFAEIRRVLKIGGRYICISLLQEHILKKLLEGFCDGSWMFRVVRCHDVEEKTTFPVFVVVATKFKLSSKLILEVCMVGDKMQRLQEPCEVQACVKTLQDAALVTNGVATTTLGNDEEVTLDLCEPDSNLPQYTVFVVDHPFKQPTNIYAVFIVPQGRECEWLFGSAAGRRQLQQSARACRLVVATLRRGYSFPDLDRVKDDLSPLARMLAPRDYTGQIPFLTLGGDAGKREAVHAGVSKWSGEFVVEDVAVEGDTFRRLIFLDNQFLIQSEAKMRTVKSKGKTKTAVDFGHLSFYHAYMSVGVEVSQLCRAGSKVAVLGLGGGGLCMFLKRCCKVDLVAVDLDPVVVDVARRHFGLETDRRLSVQVKDGLDFLKDEADNGVNYGAVLYDMDSKDRSAGLSCPPPQFLTEEALADLKKVLDNTGHFILNLVCRDPVLHDSILQSLQSHFRHVVVVKLHEEVNEVVMATDLEPYTTERLEDATKALNKMARDANLVKIKCVDLMDFMQSARIVS